jgi:hypothetical protein
MKLNKLFLFSILVTLLCPPAVMAQEKAAEKLGQVDFPVSCSAAAQKQFDQALGALHSFGMRRRSGSLPVLRKLTLVALWPTGVLL